MSPESLPTADLPVVVTGNAPAEIIAAVPLEPASRINGFDPSPFAPIPEWLAGVDFEVIQFRQVPFMTQLGPDIPAFREFFPAIGHVFSAKNAQGQHFLRRQFGFEIGIEVSASRFGKFVAVILLHQVVDQNESPHSFIIPGNESASKTSFICGEQRSFKRQGYRKYGFPGRQLTFLSRKVIFNRREKFSGSFSSGSRTEESKKI